MKVGELKNVLKDLPDEYEITLKIDKLFFSYRTGIEFGVADEGLLLTCEIPADF
jgi:hypothetical protein